MINLYDGGAYLVNGTELIKDSNEALAAVKSKTGKDVLEFLKKLNEEGNTIVLITHDNSIADQIKRVVRIHDGKIISDETKESEIVNKQAACLPNTFALENNAKLSISTAKQPYSAHFVIGNPASS